MNLHLPAPRRRWPARLVNLAVVVVVLALAAATFVLSYTGVHAIALQAGVSAQLARVYPGTFDAVLVIACVAAIALRDAQWWVRSWTWGAIILVAAAVGAGDAAHAMNVALPHRTMEGVVAAIPWVLVLLGFSLMLMMLRYSRAQHAAASPSDPRAYGRAVKRTAGRAWRSPGAETAQPAELAVRLLPAAAPPPAPSDEPEPQTATAEHALAMPSGPPAGPAEQVPPADAAAAPGAAGARDETPGADGTPAPDSTPHPESAAVSGTGADIHGAAPATVPDHNPEASGSALSWEEHRDPSEENAPHDHPARSAASQTEDPRSPSAAAESGDPAYRRQSAAMEADDAPPFATAPFASVPRLNRVRSTPTPPEDDEE